MLIYLYKRIRVKVICMSMRNINCINRSYFLCIEFYFDWSLHQISYSIVWEPTIDENSYSMTIRIHYVNEEFGMSERGDNHRKIWEKTSRKSRGNYWVLFWSYSWWLWHEIFHLFEESFFLSWHHTLHLFDHDRSYIFHDFTSYISWMSESNIPNTENQTPLESLVPKCSTLTCSNWLEYRVYFIEFLFIRKWSIHRFIVFLQIL